MKQKGIALISSIFILLVIALMVAFGVQIMTMQKQTINYNIQGTKAYFAAHAGIERGLNSVSNVPTGCTTNFPMTLSLAGALTGFNTTVNCSFEDVTQSNDTVRVFTITSDGFYTGEDRNFASRRLSARFEVTL